MQQLKATIDRYENDKAVLIFADGQKLIIDKINLAADVKEGDSIFLTISYNENETVQKEELAKNMLKQILKKEDE